MCDCGVGKWMTGRLECLLTWKGSDCRISMTVVDVEVIIIVIRHW